MKSLEELVKSTFVGEIKAFKPGNVSDYSEGHDMTVDDFYLSADVATPFICRNDWPLGKRVYAAAEATRDAVGCNTNLGMLLLFTPLVMAAEHASDNADTLRQQTSLVLSQLEQQDADDLFAAIALAKPGGLGKVTEYDVNDGPKCSVLEAMELASHRDYVAMQYTNGFEHIFTSGLSTIEGFVKRWNRVEWATVACYLFFLSTLPDSHVQRKYGREKAAELKKQSEAVYDAFIKTEQPESSTGLLTEFDEQLKQNNINPGTSADLAATSLLVYNLLHNKE